MIRRIVPTAASWPIHGKPSDAPRSYGTCCFNARAVLKTPQSNAGTQPKTQRSLHYLVHGDLVLGDRSDQCKSDATERFTFVLRFRRGRPQYFPLLIRFSAHGGYFRVLPEIG